MYNLCIIYIYIYILCIISCIIANGRGYSHLRIASAVNIKTTLTNFRLQISWPPFCDWICDLIFHLQTPNSYYYYYYYYYRQLRYGTVNKECVLNAYFRQRELMKRNYQFLMENPSAGRLKSQCHTITPSVTKQSHSTSSNVMIYSLNLFL